MNMEGKEKQEYEIPKMEVIDLGNDIITASGDSDVGEGGSNNSIVNP